ncbi:hypothetical protein DDE05_10295, partial [Streptomyces cavourensis]
TRQKPVPAADAAPWLGRPLVVAAVRSVIVTLLLPLCASVLRCSGALNAYGSLSGACAGNTLQDRAFRPASRMTVFLR